MLTWSRSACVQVPRIPRNPRGCMRMFPTTNRFFSIFSKPCAIAARVTSVATLTFCATLVTAAVLRALKISSSSAIFNSNAALFFTRSRALKRRIEISAYFRLRTVAISNVSTSLRSDHDSTIGGLPRAETLTALVSPKSKS